jgi:hypothetical protein
VNEHGDVFDGETVRRRLDAVVRRSRTALRNALFWSAAAGRSLSPRLSLLASAIGNTALLPECDAPLEVGPGVSVRVGDRLMMRLVP